MSRYIRDQKVIDHISGLHFMLTELRNMVKQMERDLISLQGECFGKLTAINKVVKTKQDSQGEAVTFYWECECECGNMCVVSHKDLVEETITHCEECGE